MNQKERRSKKEKSHVVKIKTSSIDSDSVIIMIAWRNKRVEKFGCIALYKHLGAHTNYLEMYGKWACIHEFSITQ